VLLQFLLFIGAAAGFIFAWIGFDQAKGWKILTGGVIALALFAASCSVSPKSRLSGECRHYGRFASEC